MLFMVKTPVERLRVRTMDQKIKEQILHMRDTGLTNMFDIYMVQRLAY